jgi:hypothetical protein
MGFAGVEAAKGGFVDEGVCISALVAAVVVTEFGVPV